MRLILFAISALALLLVAALIGPSFVDWNKYKPQIIEQVKNATGLDVQIGGDLSLSVLPSPSVKIEDLVVVSPRKIRFENLLSMKSAQVSVALMPLLQKQIKVDSVTLIDPDIQIEIMEDGTPSWQTEKMAKAKEISDVTPSDVKTGVAEGAGKALDSIALDKLEIENGKLAFINHQTKVQQSAQDINVVLKADSLKGPFNLDGGLVYDGKKIKFEAETGKLPQKDEGLKIQADVSLPDAGSRFSFGGVAAIKAPYDVQGQTNIKVESPSKLAAMFGSSLASQYNQSLSLDGLLSADQNNISYNDLKLSFGSFVGNGKISVQNLQSKNPLIVNGDIKSSTMLDLDSLMGSPSKAAAPSSDSALKSAGKTPAKQSGFVPQTLTLPMPIDAGMKIDLAGVKVQGKQIKGVFVDLQKTGANSKVIFKALELPGQGKADGQLNIAYASSSKSPSGQITYADPTVTYQVNGLTNQLAEFLKAFAPDADTSAVTKLYKTAQFNLKGAVNANTVSLKDSTLKLDDMVIGLGGSYKPALNGSRAKAVIDVTAGAVDFDRIMGANGKQAAASANAGAGGAAKGSAKEAVKPLQDFSLPMDLGFDISLQKARINQADLEGLRLVGDLTGKKLTLSNASVNNFAGATLSVKGQVANLSDLSGMDLTSYIKTSDVTRLAQALKADTSKFPKGLSAVEANITTKGSVNKMAFSTNVAALGGQLDAAGDAADVLGTPSFDNLSVRLKHPNLVKAIQIVNPSFQGQAGLQQAVDFYTKAASSGKTYTLSDMKVNLGQTSFGGNLKIDTGSNIPSVRGTIQAGQIALDSLLGAKSASKSAGGSAGGGASSSSSSGERWSKTPIDLGWMKTVDVDVALSASSITYGGWNFTQPSTALKIGGGVMRVSDLKAGVFGGQAKLDTEVKAEPVSLTLASNMDNIDLEKLVKALSGSGKLQSAGTVSFDMNVNSVGGSANALINALNGKAELNGTNVTLKGFDLAKLARGLATEEKLAVSAMSLVDGAMSGGQTKFDTVKGDYNIQNGLVVIKSMVMDSAEAMIESTGSADLPKWFINVDNKITLKNVTDLQPFNVKIKGPIDNPTDTFGKNILEDYIQDKIKRKVVKELPGILGDDTTKKLQQFGILPQDAPQAAPAPTTDGTAAPTTQEVAPTQQQEAPAPKKIEKPEDALDAILNGSGKPEDAVKDVLKGLF